MRTVGIYIHFMRNKNAAKKCGLSELQFGILVSGATGQTTKEIADTLKLSKKTVDGHQLNIQEILCDNNVVVQAR